jgi:RNA-directed DNA polymerase
LDIKSFFDDVDHTHLMNFISHRISDPNVLRLVRKFLKCGVMSVDGQRFATNKGVPQGGVVSPLLANIFLHYVFDLWFEKVVRPKAKSLHAIRYADDIVVFGVSQAEVTRFVVDLRERLAKFKLTLSPEKTKVLPFGTLRTWMDGTKGSRTFDFLGFTHFIRRSSTSNKHFLSRKTSRRSFAKGLLSLSRWLRENRSHLPTKALLVRVKKHLIGHIGYFGVTDNLHSLSKYVFAVCRLLHHWLNKRSQRRNCNWTRILKLREICVPPIRIHINLRADGPIFY